MTKPDSFQAGIAAADITPDKHLEIGGGAFGVSGGTHHPLRVKASCFSQSGVTTILLSCDLLGIEEAFADRIRTIVGTRLKISPLAVLLSCTHTHGAPATFPIRNWGTPDKEYLGQLADIIIGCAEIAHNNLHPARLSAGSIPCPGVAVNRCFGAEGVSDPSLRVLQIDKEDTGRPMALFTQFGCHPVNLHSSGKYTPDFPHYLEKAIQKQTGKDVPVFFLLGAAGDQNPANFKANTPSETNARQTGEALAGKALELLPKLKSVNPKPMAFAEWHIDLSLQPLPSAEEILQFRSDVEQRLTSFEKPSPTDPAWTGLRTRIDWANEALETVESGRRQSTKTVVLQGIRLGEIAIVGIPGELFSEFGLAVAEASGFRETFMATQANGSHGYFPSRRAYDRQTYEAVHCPRFLGIHSYTPDVGERIRDGAISLLETLCRPVENRRSREFWSQACTLILGGGQKHKRPVAYLDRGGPAFVSEASGSRFRDADGHEYIDYLLGYGPIVLGHSDPEVNAAVRRQMNRGSIYSMEHPLTLELAHELIRRIPCAEMVVYFVGGSSATQGAIRCARTATGREKIIRCGYHGWFDWCVPTDPGVPKSEQEHIYAIPYNDLEALEMALEMHESAGVIVESVQDNGPADGYFDGVRTLCNKHGCVFVLDEIKTGFRFDLGGAQVPFNIKPDLATFGKALGNGFPISVLTGRRDLLMRCQETYMAATFHADALSLMAALTVIRALEERDAIRHFQTQGHRLIHGLNEALTNSGLPCRVGGFPAMPGIMENSADDPVNPTPRGFRSRVVREFCSAMQRRGIYVTGHVWFLSTAHSAADIDRTVETAEEAARESLDILQRTAPPPG